MWVKSYLLLNGQKFDNTFMVNFLEDLKLPHLYFMWPHMRQLVEGFHGHRLTSVLLREVANTYIHKTNYSHHTSNSQSYLKFVNFHIQSR